MTMENKYKVQEYLSFLIYDIGNIPFALDLREEFLKTTYKTISDLVKIGELDYEDYEALEAIKKCFENFEQSLLSERKADKDRTEELICQLITKYN